MIGKLVAYSLGFLLTATSSDVLAQAKCLSFEPDTVVVRGALERDTFPGRPNYESIAEGDEADVVHCILGEVIDAHINAVRTRTYC